MYPLWVKMYVVCGFLLIWIIILQTHFPFSTACLQDERSYLLDFKAGLNLSSGRSLSSWRGFNCCQWEGVACDYHTSHVIRLDLSNRPYAQNHELSGEIHPSLFNLHYLQHLDLSWNNFKGISMPPQLSKLQRLTYLSFLGVGFRGGVPLELGNMSRLRHLDISYNYYLNSSNFDVWVRNLRSLEFLQMEAVNLTMASEKWGEALGGLAHLTQIHMSLCSLSGKIPDLLNLTRLSHLNISGNSFPFELPSWFENVSSLVSLDLSGSCLKGSTPYNFMPRSRLSNLVLSYNPDMIGNLSFILNHSSLVSLDLSHNTLEGSIPSSFESLSSLAILKLSYNNLTGQIPPSLGELRALGELYLGHNHLSGTIPDSILKLASLKVLSLASNRLTGNISLQLFDNLTRLPVLVLSKNQFVINISKSWVSQFDHLENLGLRSCNIEGDIPAFLSQQFGLTKLDLSDNKIEGNLPSWLWDLPYLKWLNLSNNQLEGSLPHKISHTFNVVSLHRNRLHGSLPAFDFVSEILDLSDNEFNGSIPATIGSKNFLSLSGNNLTGEIPSFACNVTYPVGVLVGMEILNLSKNKLTGMIPASIGRCSNLLVLNLAQNALQGKIPEELGNLQILRTLNVNSNRLQGTIPSSIANCTGLQVLDLGNNKFEGRIPVWIENVTDLKILSLAFNKFEGNIPPQLIKLQNLQILDLSGNSLSGNIPRDVGKLYAMLNQSQSNDIQVTIGTMLTRLDGYDLFSQYVDDVTVWIKGRALTYQKIINADKFMDLSRNKLSGDIPSELGFLKGLVALNISNNNLSGSIPESIGAMANLESLDLSNNKLAGKIPFQLLNLTFLAVLDLSDNMLCGLIPQGKQFSTFEATSFLGNPSLHGPPLENRTKSPDLGGRENHNNTVVADAEADVMDRWWAVGVGLSYGVGFATLIAVLCFHMKWRCKCFSLMDNLIYHLFEG